MDYLDTRASQTADEIPRWRTIHGLSGDEDPWHLVGLKYQG
jgi:hypothetical protein